MKKGCYHFSVFSDKLKYCQSYIIEQSVGASSAVNYLSCFNKPLYPFNCKLIEIMTSLWTINIGIGACKIGVVAEEKVFWDVLLCELL